MDGGRPIEPADGSDMAADTPTERWYWCLRHRRPEPGGERCPAESCLGPYSSREEALGWKAKVEDRNERWDEQDRAWSGDSPDD